MDDDEVTELHSIPPDINAKEREMDASLNEDKDLSSEDAPDEGATGNELRYDTDPESVMKKLLQLRSHEMAPVKKAPVPESRSARAARPNLEEESNPEDEEEEDEFEDEYKSRFPNVEANNVLKYLHETRKKEDMGQKKEAALKGRPKRSRFDNQDNEEDDEKEEDEDGRTTVYSSDVKDLVSDDHHATIEKEEAIAHVMAEAKKYLGGFKGVKLAWNKIGGSSYSAGAISCLASHKLAIEEEVKYLMRDVPLVIDNRAILVYLDTIRFARLKSTEAKAFLKEYDIHKHAIAAFEACPDVTKSAFPYLHRNVETVLSASSKQSIRMCGKKSEQKILIFVVRLHYCVLVKEAFRLAAKLKTKEIKFDFATFPELEAVLTELERDREFAVTAPVKKKPRTKAESEANVPQDMDLMARLDGLESNIIQAIEGGFQNLWHNIKFNTVWK